MHVPPMITPEIRELQVFLALARAGSFSAAAKRLGVTQPAVSAQIAKLEQEIGFPLFFRSPEGTDITDQGRALIPLVEEIEREYTDLRLRAAYWNRSQTKEVKIWLDGSWLAQEARGFSKGTEDWQDLSPASDWIDALRNFEVDIVISGSFLKAGEAPDIKTLPLYHQAGVTIAWNPLYHHQQPFSFSNVLSSTVILPDPSLAFGFREYLSSWCESAYGFPLPCCLESHTETDALDACKVGLGILIFPGDAASRMPLAENGLIIAHDFKFLLPHAFTFGIRYRAEEQNPQIISTAGWLQQKLSSLARK